VPFPEVQYRSPQEFSVLRINLANAKIVKIQFNANLYLQGFPHFITFKECRKVLVVKENDTQELSNSMFLNVITSSF